MIHPVLRITFSVILINFLISCEKDDDLTAEDSFYSGAVTTADKADLNGTWAFYGGIYEGRQVQLPVNFQECGRDFFSFNSDFTYSDYVYTSSDCNFVNSTANWSLNSGIITLNSDFLTEEYVITKLNTTELHFKVRVDIDDDGIKDEVTLQARPYQPKAIDTYTYSFNTDYQALEQGKIRYTWNAYSGYYDFDRYEIYRSTTCSKADATVVATFSDPGTTFYEETALTEGVEEVCYFLKIYTSKGLLGESELKSINTTQLGLSSVNLTSANASGQEITLNWQAYSGSFFSHYEITVSNMDPDMTGYGEQHLVVKTIEDQNTTSFTDTNPPYFANPVYGIKVYTIFGKSSFLNAQSQKKVNYKRPGIIGIQNISKFTVAEDDSTLYFFGKTGDYTSGLIKFNYETGLTEAVANKTPNSSSSSMMRLISGENGNELIFNTSGGLMVYKANDLSFKYELNPSFPGLIEDFILLKKDIYVLISMQAVYTFKRENQNFTLIDTKTHFETQQNYTGYQLLAVSESELLIGHKEEPQSVYLTVDENGRFTSEPLLKPIQFVTDKLSPPVYNKAQKIVLNTHTNKIFSTNTFTQTDSFEEPYNPTDLSENGNWILGNNTDPETDYEEENLFKKEVVIYNRTTKTVVKKTLKGYPVYVFSRNNGSVYSISSGLRMAKLSNFYQRESLFVEKINL